MDDTTVELLTATFRTLFAGTAPAVVPAALHDAGWVEVFRDDPSLACCLLFEEQGRQRAVSGALDLMLLAELGDDRLEAAVVWPGLRRSMAPSSRLRDGRVHVEGVMLVGHERATRLVVPALAEAGVVLAEVGPDVPVRPLRGVDPEAGWVATEGAAEPLRPPVPIDWPAHVALAQRCVGHELVGLAEAVLATTVEHVTQRTQFGRPIGTFQAVKHQVADVLVAITAARRALSAAWTTSDVVPTWAAKALAGRAAAAAGRVAQQVSGAMGFVDEHSVHRYVRRTLVLDGLLGPGEWLRDEVGRALASGRALPRVPTLVAPASR